MSKPSLSELDALVQHARAKLSGIGYVDWTTKTHRISFTQFPRLRKMLDLQSSHMNQQG